jgi:hypothetical protein
VIEKDLPVGHADEAFNRRRPAADVELHERYVEILDEWSLSRSRPEHTEKLAA